MKDKSKIDLPNPLENMSWQDIGQAVLIGVAAAILIIAFWQTYTIATKSSHTLDIFQTYLCTRDNMYTKEVCKDVVSNLR